MKKFRGISWLLSVALIGLLFSNRLLAHCDTLAGPVIQDAGKALEKGEVAGVLKWVKPENEAEIKTAFQRALKLRQGKPKVRDIAEMEFFNVLVRIHRKGEGAPFYGVKSAETVLPPAILAADKALKTGSSQQLIDLLTKNLRDGVSSRFEEVQEKKKQVDASVAHGREYVAAYVEYVHFVEGLEKLLEGGHGHHDEGPKAFLDDCPTCGSQPEKKP